MSDLVVIEFPTEAKAEEVRQKLLDMQKDYLIELSNAVIAIKQPNSRIKLNQLYHPAATGAALQSGDAALFLLIRKVTADKVLEDLKGVGGKVLRTFFDHTKEEALRTALAAAAEAAPNTEQAA